MTEKSIRKLRTAFFAQASGATRRGIEFKLTFEQWIEWWGDDIDRRGRKPWQLQMQRKCDKGPYELGNIVKGHPKRNAETKSNVHANAKQEALRRAHQEELDRLMWEPSKEPEDDREEGVGPTIWACNGNVRDRKQKGFAPVKE